MRSSDEETGHYYHQQPQQQHHQHGECASHPPPPPPPPLPPHHYGTFQGCPPPPPPGFPYPVHPSQAPRYSAYQPVPGYPVVEGMTVDRQLGQLPCCGIGIGWFLFITGFILATIPWFVGAFILVCVRHDYRERVGLICCTIAAILSLLAGVIGGSKGTQTW